MDIVQPVLKTKILGWEDATLNIAMRLEYVDWNIGEFEDTGDNIADDVWSIMPAISFRPTAQTVLRLNYRYLKQQDIIGNPPATTGGIILECLLIFEAGWLDSWMNLLKLQDKHERKKR